MIRALSLAGFGLAVLGLAGCTNPDGSRNNVATNATAGAIGGAVVGNLIGGDSRSTLIGATLGGAGGAAVGANQDNQQSGY